MKKFLQNIQYIFELLAKIRLFQFIFVKIAILNSIDQISIHFNPNQLHILNICLGFLLFGVALEINPDDFKKIILYPKAILVGLTTQLLLFPILTILFILIINPPTSIALGMVLVAACPSGNVSNFAVKIANGNTALSVTLTSILSLIAIVTTPLSFSIYSKMVPNSEILRKSIYVEPIEMVLTIIQIILIPLCIGMLFNWKFPKTTLRFLKTIKILSLLLFLSFIVVGVFKNLDIVQNHLGSVFFIVLVHNFIGLFGGYQFAKWMGLDFKTAKTLCLEAGIHNTGLGLVLIFNFFNGIGGMALIAAWWGIWDMIAAFSLAQFWEKRD